VMMDLVVEYPCGTPNDRSPSGSLILSSTLSDPFTWVNGEIANAAVGIGVHSFEFSSSNRSTRLEQSNMTRNSTMERLQPNPKSRINTDLVIHSTLSFLS
jgi:hypothetical protein